MPSNSRPRQIPMLCVYAEQFRATDPRALTGRKGRLFIEICRPKKVTRKQLAADFDIRPGTVSSLVLQLIERGLVDEARPTTPYQKGRPEILLRPVTARLGVMVFYVVSQSIHATLIDIAGNELCSATQQVHAGHIENGQLEILMTSMAENLRKQAPPATEIVGVSFSLPGIVDEENKSWVFATSRWPQIQHMDFSRIGQKLGLNVMVNKNLNCELRARIARRQERASSNILFIHWGHGIGASYSLNGETLVSGNGGFGEIGHTYAHCQERVRCRCGLDNCLETQAALWALLPRIRALYPQVPTDEWKFESFLKTTEGFDTSILNNAVHQMAVAMRNLTLILSPHQIVLTGALVQHPEIFERLCDEFRGLLPSQSHVFSHSNIKIAAARAGTEDEIIGAAYPLFAQALEKLCG